MCRAQSTSMRSDGHIRLEADRFEFAVNHTSPGRQCAVDHHHLRLRPSTKEASVTRQSGSALCNCPVGLHLKRNVYSSSLRGALSALFPRFRSPQCLVALCIVHSIEAERSEGGNFWT